MTNTTIIVTNFTNNYASLNGSIQTKISKMDIARGMLSIGKTHWVQYFNSPAKTYIDFLHYWTGLIPYINERPNLVINSNFAGLDLSDKIQKSYHIGMGVTKIVAEKVLEVPYLQHVDSLVRLGIATITSGTNERGDMVGLDKQKNWHVIEAKGRTNLPSNKTRQGAKRQAQRIQAISGVAPKTKSYCIAYLNEISSQMFLDDPEGDIDKQVLLSLTADDFVKAYYDKLFKDFYDQEPDMILNIVDLNISFSLFKISNQDGNMYIGLENTILRNLKKGKIKFAKRLIGPNGMFDNLTNLNIDNLSIGIDGIVLFEDTSNQISGRKSTANLAISTEGIGLLELMNYV